MTLPVPRDQIHPDAYNIVKDKMVYKIRGKNPRASLSSAKMVAKKLEYREKTEKALRLKATGMTDAQIAKAVGFTNALAANRAMQRALDDLTLEPAEHLVKTQLAGLDQLQAVLWADFMRSVSDPDKADLRIRLADAIQRIYDRMGKLVNVQDVLDGVSPTAQVNQQIHLHNSGGVLIIDGNAPEYMKAMEEASGSGAPELDFKNMFDNNNIDGEVIYDEIIEGPLQIEQATDKKE